MKRIQIEQQKCKRVKEKVHIKQVVNTGRADSSQKIGCHIFENYMKTEEGSLEPEERRKRAIL